MRFLTFLLAMLVGLTALNGHAQAAGLYGHCDVIETAASEMPILMIADDCTGTLQNRMYGAVAAVSDGNAQSAAAQLGMLKVETGCGTNRNNATLATCTGLYNASARSAACPNCTASGATQITNATWQEIVTSSATRRLMIDKLGGCSPPAPGFTPGSLLDKDRTADGIVRNQFIAFRESLCGRGSGRPAVTDKNYWNSMVGVSILAADAYDTSVTGRYQNNAALNRTLNGLNVNTNAVIRYAGHNLGPGDGADLLNALSSNPNQSVSNFLSSTVINNNPGLYCVGGRRPCTPVSAAQAAQNMQTTMFSGSCVRTGLQNMNMPITNSDLPVAGGMEAVCREGPNDNRPGTMLCGASNAEVANEMLLGAEDGGLAGEDNANALHTYDCSSCFHDNTAEGRAAIQAIPAYSGTVPPLKAQKNCQAGMADGSSTVCSAGGPVEGDAGVGATEGDGDLSVQSGN